MTKLTLLGAAAILAMGLATPALSQEATQEPGMIGFNYPNSDYLLGGYGVRTPSRYDYSYYYGPRAYYGPRVYYRPGYVAGPVGLAAGVAAGTAAAIAGAPFVDSYAYYDEPGYW
ncbi:hypothetical protein IVA95_16495 [Bradyrhizobium sp. 157]|jgi:hypothetical protein|uniref:hypothetical protein n=1 Tax=Bradyrhizobium sp. 157 TaxID=2782631 RepID=UPI001FF8DB59|nr:hypothetical protein [Bradyrhizobium sp. 157]MCK1639159.1 hypothetical protein [Bradyrhizobium sp. 157]